MHGEKFRLNVLNPGGGDEEQHFGSTAPVGARLHAPVNFHAYAACTGGSWCRDTRTIKPGDPVLLLLRGDFRASARALKALKKSRAQVAVSLKETGLHQIAKQMGDPARLARFLQILKEADGCIGATPESAEIYRALRGGSKGVRWIATPYPIHDPQWDFSRPMEERRGILVGTREWEVPSRNHFAALCMAKNISDATGEIVTVFNLDGRKGERGLRTLGFRSDQLRVLKGSLEYTKYLKVVAEHKIVFQLDASFVPGQVAGDALLCRLPCVGGNGAIERQAFPDFCGTERAMGELVEIAIGLLQDARVYKEAVIGSQQRAAERLSFSAGAQQLRAFFHEAIASK